MRRGVYVFILGVFMVKKTCLLAGVYPEFIEGYWKNLAFVVKKPCLLAGVYREFIEGCWKNRAFAYPW